MEVKETVPENPLRLAKLTITVPDDPGATVSEEGLRVILKSGMTTVTVTVVECDPSEPAPVTVTE